VGGLVGRSEDLYLEVKRCANPLAETDKHHLAEALSGFANADGGTLIYGLVASGGDKSRGIPDTIGRVESLASLETLRAEVSSLVGQVVQPPVESVQVVTREFTRQPGEGFLLVFVPASDALPHRSKRDREYYRRHGSGFYRIEHFELAEIFGRRPLPVLKINWDLRLGAYSAYAPNRRFQCLMTIGIENNGRGTARYPAILLRGVVPHSYGLDGNGNFGLPRRPLAEPRAFLFGGGADDVIYPGTVLQITALEPQCEKIEVLSHFDDLQFEYTLYADGLPARTSTILIRGEELKARFDARVREFR